MARTAAAGVIRRAGVAVVARIRVVHVQASKHVVANIRGTDVAVVAIRRRTTNARTTRTRIARRTSVSVVARTRVI